MNRFLPQPPEEDAATKRSRKVYDPIRKFFQIIEGAGLSHAKGAIGETAPRRRIGVRFGHRCEADPYSLRVT